MYYLVADESTAVNFGQGNLKVSESRGYKRKTYIEDGGFEGYKCDDQDEEDIPFCFTASDSAWQGTSPANGNFDASIFHYQPYAHDGNSVALLGSAFGSDSLPGTLSPASPLALEAGQQCSLQFFHSSFYSGEQAEQNAFVQIKWNGETVDTIRGYSQWAFHQYTLTAKGNDVLQFTGGAAPAYTFIDSVNVFCN